MLGEEHRLSLIKTAQLQIKSVRLMKHGQKHHFTRDSSNARFNRVVKRLGGFGLRPSILQGPRESKDV